MKNYSCKYFNTIADACIEGKLSGTFVRRSGEKKRSEYVHKKPHCYRSDGTHTNAYEYIFLDEYNFSGINIYHENYGGRTQPDEDGFNHGDWIEDFIPDEGMEQVLENILKPRNV